MECCQNLFWPHQNLMVVDRPTGSDPGTLLACRKHPVPLLVCWKHPCLTSCMLEVPHPTSGPLEAPPVHFWPIGSTPAHFQLTGNTSGLFPLRRKHPGPLLARRKCLHCCTGHPATAPPLHWTCCCSRFNVATAHSVQKQHVPCSGGTSRVAAAHPVARPVQCWHKL